MSLAHRAAARVTDLHPVLRQVDFHPLKRRVELPVPEIARAAAFGS